MIRKILFYLTISLSAITTYAQSWEVGGGLGATGYMGDLNPVKPYILTDPAISLQVKRNFTPYLSLKASGMLGKIRAKDSDSENSGQIQRNLSFFSTIVEGTVQAEFNFFHFQADVGKNAYSPYIFAGIGGVAFEPKAVLNGEVYKLRDYGTEGQTFGNNYNSYAITVPYGAGIKVNVTRRWNLTGEVGYRTAFTDYLDDVSGRYPNPADLTNPTSLALSDRSGEVNGGNNVYVMGDQRGDFRKRDTYLFVGISLTYTFVSAKCPLF